MPRQDLEYPKDAVNSVKRLNDRASYSLRTIHTIINTSRLLHVSFTTPTSPFPTTLPMIGHMGSFARPSADESDVLDLYLHGYVSMRLATLCSDPASPLPVCVSAAHVDGLVLALSPFSSSYNYRSAVIFGHATLVPAAEVDERLYALRLITDAVVAGRWDNARGPPTPAEMQSTSVLRVRIVSGSAKIRAGEPHDDLRDANDAELCGRVWTGVVPLHQTLGEPIPGPLNGVGEVPRYLADYIKDSNEASVEAALLGTVEPKKAKSKHDDE